MERERLGPPLELGYNIPRKGKRGDYEDRSRNLLLISTAWVQYNEAFRLYPSPCNPLIGLFRSAVWVGRYLNKEESRLRLPSERRGYEGFRCEAIALEGSTHRGIIATVWGFFFSSLIRKLKFFETARQRFKAFTDFLHLIFSKWHFFANVGFRWKKCLLLEEIASAWLE